MTEEAATVVGTRVWKRSVCGPGCPCPSVSSLVVPPRVRSASATMTLVTRYRRHPRPADGFHTDVPKGIGTVCVDAEVAYHYPFTECLVSRSLPLSLSLSARYVCTCIHIYTCKRPSITVIGFARRARRIIDDVRRPVPLALTVLLLLLLLLLARGYVCLVWRAKRRPAKRST